MGLIGPEDQARLRTDFGQMRQTVHLLFFTQTLDCDTCLQTRQILDELPLLSDRIVVDEVNFILEPDRAREYGVDRVPAIALAYEAEDDGSGAPAEGGAGDRIAPLRDSRIRFLGAPAGFEFISLVQAILIVGGRDSQLSASSRQLLSAVHRPVTLHVFTTPTCPHCPRAVVIAHEMAYASPHVTAYAVEATAFPDLVRRYQVNGVPKTVVDETIEIMGAIPEDAFVSQALVDAARG